MLLTCIIPCYNEEESLPYFYSELCKTEQILHKRYDLALESIYINDGSADGTLALLKKLRAADPRIRYISFSRNFGKEAAIYAGLQHARGDYVVLMDADLQDPPALLPELLRAVIDEGFDAAATRRATRKGEPPLRSMFARLFYRIMNSISQTELMDGARDYRLMSRPFVNALLQMSEYNRFTKGLFGWVGFKTKWIEFDNVERVAGSTKWSFWGLLRYALEGLVAFSTLPLLAATFLGIACCILAFAATGFIIVKKLLFGDPIQGWASTATIILTIGGLQLLCAGVLGQYIAKIYLEVKRRPVYIINEKDSSL